MNGFVEWPPHVVADYRRQGFWLDKPLTDLLTTSFEAAPSSIAIICGERIWTYADLERYSTNLARSLARRGITRGSTAMVQLPNCAEFYATFFGLLKAGIVPVNLLFSHRQLELLAYAKQLQPAIVIGSCEHGLFFDVQFYQELQSVSSSLKHLIVLGEQFFADELTQLLTEPDFPNPLINIRPTCADKPAFFQLSGGSTGTPKLIPRTQNDYYYSIRQSAAICRLTPKSRYLCALPAGHNFPLSSPGALGVLYAGGTLVVAKSPEPNHCFELIKQHQVTFASLVPSAVLLWLNAAKTKRAQLSSLEFIQVGGANFSKALAERITPELGCKLQQVFGMAEGLVNFTRLDDPADIVINTQGRPMSSADEIRLLNEFGEPVGIGRPGILHTRGPYTVRGYFSAPEHNARVFDADGFYCTGDIAIQDAFGNLQVVGRIKDQINRGGEKIAAEELENILIEHPAISEAAVISLQDYALGEKIGACLVVHQEVSLFILRRYLRERGLADYKLPDHIFIFDSLPLTPIGKINKVLLRDWVRKQSQQFSKASVGCATKTTADSTSSSHYERISL
ncbi:MAG: (2,3-dihydroxybenzoyl)adenylate synthase [Cellvibrio sp.]